MTPELRQARAGKMTASKAAVLMGGLETEGLKSYVMDLAWERVYGADDDESYQSEAMKRGQRVEADALAWYAFETDSVIDHDPDRTINHPSVPMVAASPDALRADRVIEVKSPLHRAWMDVARTGQVPSAYRWQCRWQMWCAGVASCDFVAYHPQSGGIIVPFNIDDESIIAMIERVPIIEAKISAWIDVLTTRKAA